MSDGSSGASTGPCLKIVLIVFGGLILIAVLSVPVTTTTSALRQDPGSQLVFRTTYPKNTTMFLPSYLAAKAQAKGGEVRLRSAQWAGTVGIVFVLGVFDLFFFCRLLRRPRPRTSEPGPDTDGEDLGRGPRSSGLSLFP
jgi:hypothetical protein